MSLETWDACLILCTGLCFRHCQTHISSLMLALFEPNQSNLFVTVITTKLTLFLPQGSDKLNMRHLSSLITCLFSMCISDMQINAARCSQNLIRSSVLQGKPVVKAQGFYSELFLSCFFRRTCFKCNWNLFSANSNCCICLNVKTTSKNTLISRQRDVFNRKTGGLVCPAGSLHSK